MEYSSCPTDLVRASASVVWDLLTNPAGWGEFFDIRITRLCPEGPAAVGQKIYGETGPSILHLKVEFEVRKIDPEQYRLDLAIRLPFRLAVQETVNCIPAGPDQCRVVYHCDFSLPPGRLGRLTRLALHRQIDAGPADSLRRLKLAAQKVYAIRRPPPAESLQN